MPRAYDPAERQAAILDAALACFLAHGYARTSMAAIASRARLSRSLLYLEFASKEELFGALIERLLDQHFERAMQAQAGKGSRRERLLAVVEAWDVSLYARVAASPHGDELFAESYRLKPRLDAMHRRRTVELIAPLIADEARREVFLLALKGQQADRPSAETLRRRMPVLVGLFTPGPGK